MTTRSIKKETLQQSSDSRTSSTFTCSPRKSSLAQARSGCLGVHAGQQSVAFQARRAHRKAQKPAPLLPSAALGTHNAAGNLVLGSDAPRQASLLLCWCRHALRLVVFRCPTLRHRHLGAPHRGLGVTHPPAQRAGCVHTCPAAPACMDCSEPNRERDAGGGPHSDSEARFR